MNKRGKCSVQATDQSEREPDFIKRLKKEIGYKDDSPTVDTKRENLPTYADSDGNESDADDGPQVVVLNPSRDLTKEEADAEKLRLEKEEAEKPANLNEKIVFKSKKGPKKPAEMHEKVEDKKRKKKSKSDKKAQLLSFDADEDDETG